jgi:hypothetical protein
MGGLLTRDPLRVRVHSTQDPVVSPGEAAYPVVIMRPGLHTERPSLSCQMDASRHEGPRDNPDTYLPPSGIAWSRG